MFPEGEQLPQCFFIYKSLVEGHEFVFTHGIDAARVD